MSNQNHLYTILKEYDRKKFKAERELRQRQEEIYEKIPAYKDIHDSIANLGRDYVASLGSDSNKPSGQGGLARSSQVKKKINDLMKMKEALLIDHGYPKDFLTLKYECDKCQDTGFVNNQKCNCLKQALVGLAYEQSNIKSLLERENFDTFDFDKFSKEKNDFYGISPYDNMRILYRLCKDYALTFADHSNNLILYGGTGVGKTFLCNCIARLVLDSGFTVIYLSSSNLFKMLEEYRFNKAYTNISFEDIDQIYGCDLLIIDDLGTEPNTSFTASELFNCLNTRLLAEKSTIISTNLHENEWKTYYSERLVSRIMGYYKILALFGDDKRTGRYS